MNVVELHVYPLKSAGGISLQRTDVLRGGFRHDRRFMLVDANGSFISQRSQPRLALVTTAMEGSSLILTTPRGASATVPLAPEGPRRTVRIWNDIVEAIEVSGDAARMFSDYTGAPCSLVFMPEEVVRPLEAPYGKPGERVGFADGFPVLLATRPSLDELNGRLAEPIRMNRFRANLVVEGGTPFEEDLYARVHIGSIGFRMPKRCARCEITTVEQETGRIGKEPLRTLAKYRVTDKHVYFAQNIVPDREGSIALGDAVTYLEPLRR